MEECRRASIRQVAARTRYQVKPSVPFFALFIAATAEHEEGRAKPAACNWEQARLQRGNA
jgi:hypothetical protein